jgi:hypothetical protein
LTAEAIQQVWILSLVVFAVVLVVVAALLTLILSTAKQIHGGVAAIWTAGQKVANNTIHLAMLHRTNHLAGQILESAVGVAGATAAIASHAGGCPGCPACVLGDSRGGR